MYWHYYQIHKSLAGTVGSVVTPLLLHPHVLKYKLHDQRDFHQMLIYPMLLFLWHYVYTVCPRHHSMCSVNFLSTHSLKEMNEWQSHLVKVIEELPHLGPFVCTLSVLGTLLPRFMYDLRDSGAVSEVTISWLDFDSFIYTNCHSEKETNKQKPKWNTYNVPGIVLKGKDTAKKEKCLTLWSLCYHKEDKQ